MPNIKFDDLRIIPGEDVLTPLKWNNYVTALGDLHAYAHRVHFTYDGKVGIGTSDPKEALHVEGNSIIKGSLRIDDIKTDQLNFGPWRVEQIGGGNDTSYLRILRKNKGKMTELFNIDWHGNTNVMGKLKVENGDIENIKTKQINIGPWSLYQTGGGANNTSFLKILRKSGENDPKELFNVDWAGNLEIGPEEKKDRKDRGRRISMGDWRIQSGIEDEDPFISFQRKSVFADIYGDMLKIDSRGNIEITGNLAIKGRIDNIKTSQKIEIGSWKIQHGKGAGGQSSLLFSETSGGQDRVLFRIDQSGHIFSAGGHNP